jgi:hypothetical protein
LGFPIRTSPDNRLLASPRGLSQLATSFIAYLRQGIHTHALSSLTIKLTLRSEFSPARLYRFPIARTFSAGRAPLPDIGFLTAVATCSCPSITIQFSKNQTLFCIRCRTAEVNVPPRGERSLLFSSMSWWAWVDSNYRPHPYQGCALTT